MFLGHIFRNFAVQKAKPMVLTLFTLLFAAVFFVWGKIRADVVSLIALLILAVGGIITPSEALSGFANPIVIMMVGLFVVGGAIFNTGLAKMIGARIIALAGKSELRLFLLVMGGTSLIGAFVSNTGTVALMLPIVVSMAAGSGISASRLLMPLAFASSMGGMMTLIGTPPNLVIAEVWEEAGHGPISFFTFLPGGLICVVCGTVFLIFLSKWFLTKKGSQKGQSSNGPKTLQDMVEEYGLNSGMFKMEVPRSSTACGLTLANLDLRRKYGLEVLEVRRTRSKGLLKRLTQYAPGPSTVIKSGDVLYIRGDVADIEAFAAAYNIDFEIDKDEPQSMEFYDIGLAEIVLMPRSPIINKTVEEIGFRKMYGVSVIAIRRNHNYITTDLGSTPIKGGDVLLVQGSWSAIDGLNTDNGAWVVLGQPLAEASKVTLDYKAPLAAAIMIAMVVSLVVDIIPPVYSVMIAALLMVLCGCFRNVDDAYKKINWESTVLIAAMMPMSFALEKTGVSALVADGLVGALGSMGSLPVLAGIYFTTSVMTLFISNTATAVLLAPIALESAVALGVNPLPFLFAVTYGASLCFASPFSTPPNALVMPAGNYTFADYLKVGAPLQLILGIIMVMVLPLLFPF